MSRSLCFSSLQALHHRSYAYARVLYLYHVRATHICIRVEVCTYPEPVGDGLRIIRAVASSVVVGDDSGAAAEEELGRGRGAGEEGLRGEADGEGELEVVPLPGPADPRLPLAPAGGFGGGQQLGG